MIYSATDRLSTLLSISSSQRTQALLAAPKAAQALISAVGDVYTFKLAAHVYGERSHEAWYTLALSLGSAWNWFVSTRTFSNCLETTLTIIALYNWPLHWALGTHEVGFQVDRRTLRIRQPDTKHKTSNTSTEIKDDETTRLRWSLICAATAVVLRPTNIIIWLVLVITTFGRGIWHHGMHWEINAFLRESLICGGSVLGLTALIDRSYYGFWTLPLWNFFRFNVLQSLAVFYGNNNWHYYITQGYPLLLTATIIPTVVGMAQIFHGSHQARHSQQSNMILHRLALVAVTLPLALSILSHKEVRFIYPVLPPLLVIAAGPVSQIMHPSSNHTKVNQPKSRINGNLLITGMFAINLAIAAYFSLVHNSGLNRIPEYFHHELEYFYTSPSQDQGQDGQARHLTFAILMPCHSLPWRSHFQHSPSELSPGISGWALTCEPPINLNATEKTGYLDEADVFYINPPLWLKKNMARTIPRGLPQPGIYASVPEKKLYRSSSISSGVWVDEGQGWLPQIGHQRRAWPDYLVFFAQLEPLMQQYLAGSKYGQCSRIFNSHFHDDSRRVGDIVIWCLHHERHSVG